MKKLLFAFLLVFLVSSIYADSLTVVFQGIKKGEKYKIYYKGNFVKIIESKKDFFRSTDSLRVSIIGINDGDGLGLDVYRKGRFSIFYRNTYFGTFYDSSKKYLIIYRDEKLKLRYAITPIWRNQLLIYW